MLTNYITMGLFYCIYLIPLAFFIFLIDTILEFIIKRKFNFKPLTMLCKFLWILTVLAILKITGIIGGSFEVSSLFEGNVNISFGLLEEGFSTATILNIVLFIPFGFFLQIVFKKLENEWLYGLLTGLEFSLIIEFLQMFIGRYVQLDDIIMNTLGSFCGYEIFSLLIKIKHKVSSK